MKNKHWINHLFGALFAFLLSLCSVGCIVTGFDLPVSAETVRRLFIVCGGTSVFSALLLYLPLGGFWLLLALLPAAKFLWSDGLLWDQLKTIAYTISSHFHNVYGWKTIGEAAAEEMELALLLLAGITVLSVNLCICRSLPFLTAMPAVLLPIGLCLVTTDTLPDEHWLCLLIAGIGLLMLTDLVRRRNPVQGGILTLLLILPAAVALTLLFALNPQENYVSRAGELQKETVTWFQKAITSVESVMNGNISGIFSNQTLNLRNVGPKSNLSYSVMRVYSPYTGTLYLRGQDYDIYTGTSWESSPERNEIFTDGSDTTVSGTVSISTYGVHQMLYIPYYSTETVTLTGGSAANWENLNSYSFPYSRIPAVLFGSGTVDHGYTDLPSETREWAENLLDTLLTGKEATDHIIQKIKNYVQRSALYDRSTEAMDSEYIDFARWFLEESDTGYCVHFATAAAVLLRAAGIPARYVEGYMVNCKSSSKNIVTNQEAHAWVEYFDPVFSVWWILETTPVNVTVVTENIPEETQDNSPENDEILPEEESSEPDQISPSVPTDTAQNSITSSDTVSDEEEEDSEEEESVSVSGNSGHTENTVSYEEKKQLPEWIWILFVLLTILAAVPIQSSLRIFRKRRLWNTGTPNETALNRWKQLQQITRRMKIRLPRELEESALKAKFSQHTLTAEELKQFDLFRQKVLTAIRKLPWCRRFLLRWIFAIG